MAENGERISISRDALRAELAELELRLIDKLASKIDVEKLAGRVDVLERNALRRDDADFRRVNQEVVELKNKALTPNDIDASVANALQNKEARGWTNRERWIGVALFLITVSTFALQLRGL